MTVTGRTREIPRPAGENAGLRDDAISLTDGLLVWLAYPKEQRESCL